MSYPGSQKKHNQKSHHMSTQVINPLAEAVKKRQALHEMIVCEKVIKRLNTTDATFKGTFHKNLCDVTGCKKKGIYYRPVKSKDGNRIVDYLHFCSEHRAHATSSGITF